MASPTAPNEFSVHFFHITGFGRFASIETNPAKLTVETLHDFLSSTHPNSSSIGKTLQKPHHHQNTANYTQPFTDIFRSFIPFDDRGTPGYEIHINTNTLQVDVQTVEEYFALKYQEIALINKQQYSRFLSTENSQAVPSKFSVHHHFIHVGVHGGAKCIHLEEFSYNNATFRCQDELKFEPDKEPIRHFNPQTGQIQCQVLKLSPGANQSSDNESEGSEQIQSSPWFISPQPSSSSDQPNETLGCPASLFKPPTDVEYDTVLQTQHNLDLMFPKLKNIHQELMNPESSRFLQIYQNRRTEPDTLCDSDPTPVSSLIVAPVTITNDPGGFVCNYLYFVSLYYTKFLFPFLGPSSSSSSSSQSEGDFSVHFSSLFYHIPLPATSSIENNMAVLLSTIYSVVLDTPTPADTSNGLLPSSSALPDLTRPSGKIVTTLSIREKPSVQDEDGDEIHSNSRSQSNHDDLEIDSVSSVHPLIKYISVQNGRRPRQSTLNRLQISQSQQASKPQGKGKGGIDIDQIAQDIAAFLPKPESVVL